ncbi:hypothetical protein HHL22_09335 [Hymenobacter sp. RP-2-7]|uniref:Uncharacterized protein n=1 Tax=Hymenobacter polaris TaxID=2682546 RepID=A0A7Y0AE28_9BACT|nr:hypothetical protein [Hymenobacter polaris]NML65405.1 hypothetical protein [Hymenobacter polaris]
MTADTFQQLSQTEQLWVAFKASTFLARRWQSGGSVNLYHLLAKGHELFIEVACADAPGCPIRWVRTHTTSQPLLDYADDVLLPEL